MMTELLAFEYRRFYNIWRKTEQIRIKWNCPSKLHIPTSEHYWGGLSVVHAYISHISLPFVFELIIGHVRTHSHFW